jgi:hypothetical protein
VQGKGCRYIHHKLLHGAVADKTKKEEVVPTATDVTVLTGATGEQALRLLQLYVQACVKNKKTIYHVMALLKSSSLTMILREDVSHQFGTGLTFEEVAVPTTGSLLSTRSWGGPLQVC